ncbi:MAG: NADH:ubiquinone reductase (Na(+)-transporting) subunit B [Myxococcales bacterium]|nr:NADH:ubiquinone reductase (Na(+)-transporting) subunit B [Myxococcales bacterium]
MKVLRKILDEQAKLFEKGGPLEKLYPLWEANDTILYTPGTVTKGTTHVRDALDLKRMMITVVVALIPCVLMALYNTGYQANLAIEQGQGVKALLTWQTQVMELLGLPFKSWHPISNLVHGGLYFLPVFITVFAVGGLIEVVFAILRGHEINEGFLVSGFLLPLTLPPTIPLWQVALGTGFGILFGKEVFGGTGKNFLNPALTARAFLFFAYPAQISGDKPWIAADFSFADVTSTLPDAVSGATWLGKSATSHALGEHAIFGPEWIKAFYGFVPGSMGETSALACLMGAVILVATQVGSWRTMLGVIIGTVGTASLLNLVGSETNPMFAVPFGWHMVIGSWAFATVFMATDPVSSAFTESGKLLYGIGIGFMGILIRVVNPAYPEGMMLAILFMNVFAPLIDHYVVEANIKRRLARHAA